jgi:hypothetical protein
MAVALFRGRISAGAAIAADRYPEENAALQSAHTKILDLAGLARSSERNL